jgi:hypothetical protein
MIKPNVASRCDSKSSRPDSEEPSTRQAVAKSSFELISQQCQHELPPVEFGQFYYPVLEMKIKPDIRCGLTISAKR